MADEILDGGGLFGLRIMSPGIGKHLISPVFFTIWPINSPIKAECKRRDPPLLNTMCGGRFHKAPVANCKCGIYISTYITDAIHSLTNAFLVEGWGKTILHTRGFRSEYAQIRAFIRCKELGIVEYTMKRNEIDLPKISMHQAVSIINNRWLEVNDE